jgi:enoyl-CoA hydratase
VAYETIAVEQHDRVCLIRLNRPQVLNALCDTMIHEIRTALAACDADDNTGCVVITGSDKAFAAGADIAEMQARTSIDAMLDDFVGEWDALSRRRKPLIAAVAGFALGGGCELAMMADFILAADNAKFGQPEIRLGIMPGAGGTQRLARLVGRSKAMELCLTGRMMEAVEAERAGLVARVVPLADLVAEALKTAAQIAALSRPAVLMVRQSIDSASETGLSEGLKMERQRFYALFASADQKEGMAAFLEKRPPHFTHR